MAMNSLRRTHVLVALVAALALLSLRCGADRLEFVTRKMPAPADLTGIWVVDEAGFAATRSPRRFKNRPTFVFREDGRFSARDLPDWWNDFDRRSLGEGLGVGWVPTSGSGRWSLQRDQEGAWVMEANFSDLPGHPQGARQILPLYRQTPPYRLCVGLGDPDEGRFLIFERVADQPEAIPGR